MTALPLEVRDLRKRFGAHEALDGVSFGIEAGEVFGYLGPNGAGKTTTLRILLGLVRPDAGSASILGHHAGDPAGRESLGFLPGDLRLYGDMTASATLDFFARFRPGRPPSLREQLVAELGLDGPTLAKRVKFLSHGTRQKVGLVAAMQHDPALLLLDEPSNGLDPLVQQSFRAAVKGFAQRGRAVLFCSHALNEVEAVCHRVAILRRGRIVALDSMDRLRDMVVRRMTVRLSSQSVDLSSIPGVTRLSRDGRNAVLWVQGDLNPIFRALVDAGIEDVVFPEAELEDIFLGYYQGGAAGA